MLHINSLQQLPVIVPNPTVAPAASILLTTLALTGKFIETIELQGVTLGSYVTALVNHTNIVDKALLKSFKTNRFADILITLPLNEAALEKISQKQYYNRGEKIDAIVKLLKWNSKKMQKPIIRILKRWKKHVPGFLFKTFWSSNQITVQNANSHLVQKLAQSSPELGIMEIRKQVFHYLQPILNTTAPKFGSLAWGVDAVGAKELWKKGIDGSGIVIGNIDTGVHVTHHALRNSYRNDEFSWYDPSNSSSIEPTDNHGHGTHTTGIMCGSGPSEIGVAKGAKFIACRGCSGDNCSVNHLLSCGEFMLCPFKGHEDSFELNCSKAPNIISNSWGGGPPGDVTYRNLIKVWNYAGIIPIFAIGNSGPACQTAGSPGDDDKRLLISVGATDILNRIAHFSSKGLSYYNTTKPEISAPGVNILSACNANDDSYDVMSGTSMAAPFVSGVIALMLQKNNNLTLSEIQERLISGAKKGYLTNREFIHCNMSKKKKVKNMYPNNVFGCGIVNAINSVW